MQRRLLSLFSSPSTALTTLGHTPSSSLQSTIPSSWLCPPSRPRFFSSNPIHKFKYTKEKDLNMLDLLKNRGPYTFFFSILRDPTINPSIKRSIGINLGLLPKTYTGPGNPLLNCVTANELSAEAANLIKLFPDFIDPNARDYENKTGLIIAAKTFSMKHLLPLLLRQYHGKIDLDAQDNTGCGAMHYLHAYGHRDYIDLLARAGASMKITDHKGRTPHDYCSLDIKELISILSSIHIDPKRDATAGGENYVYMEQTTATIPELSYQVTKSGIYRPSWNMASFQQALDKYQSDKPLDWEDGLTPEKRLQQRKIVIKMISELMSKLSGRSTLEDCLIQRDKLLINTEAKTPAYKK